MLNSRDNSSQDTDHCLTLMHVARLNASHGGMPIEGDRLGILCHGNHTVELLNPIGEPEGWNKISRDPSSGLCSRSETLSALGY
ncbi:MAG: hypothetical protein KAI82_17725 [Tritonibacter mobilis]|nr:hypothetical protein [Tritonibacter mobilis]